MKSITVTVVCSLFFYAASFGQQCRFEKSNGKESATYFEAIEWYKNADRQSGKVLLKSAGTTDAGYPLHVVMVSSDGQFDAKKWHQQGKAVILINNGIHPGEPDGIDASMMLVRDIATNKIKLPANVALAFIPVYNIGGALNRGTSSRANQEGPAEYGFRGNAQNLDLNRDFTKNDSRNAQSFAEIFHSLDPDILIDNHVSDGADHQHVFTLLTTQYDKLGPPLGKWLKEEFEPKLYSGMADKDWQIFPYVNFETASADKGMEMFYDPPRYSSGYAALFQTIGFVPETHMLKPFRERVISTYAFMQTIIEQASLNCTALIQTRAAARAAILKQTDFILGWQVDPSAFSYIPFRGYEPAYKTSDATGLQRMYYDHSKPFIKDIKFYNVFKPVSSVTRPAAYILPQGWHAAADLLRLNGVQLQALKHDTVITVEAYHIDDYKSLNRPYEKHHKNYAVKVTANKQSIRFLKGDYLISTNQPAVRYLIEMLEPTGDDSFFAWNFFDGILQQKEGYSEYRWEDVAAQVLRDNPGIKKQLDDKRATDSAFAGNASAQLDFIYKRSVYYEPSHMRYPVYRLVQ